MKSATLALAVLAAAVAVGCAETPEQHSARLAVERASDRQGRGGDTRCTSNPVTLFVPGPAASVFVCIVKASEDGCDRYVVRRTGRSYAIRLRARDVDCILPAD